MGRALTRSGLVVVNAPFGDECGNFFGRSKRFRAEDHLPVPLESAIQTFSCGGSRLPFGSGAIPFRETQLAAVCSHFLSGVPTTRRDARMFTKHVSCFRLVVVCVECVHLVRSPPSWCDTRVTCFSRFFGFMFLSFQAQGVA